MTDKIPEALAMLKRAVGDQPDAPEGMTNAQAIKAFAELIDAAKLMRRMNEEAVTKFNWGASALDANAIDLLNRAPGALRRAINVVENLK